MGGGGVCPHHPMNKKSLHFHHFIHLGLNDAHQWVCALPTQPEVCPPPPVLLCVTSRLHSDVNVRSVCGRQSAAGTQSGAAWGHVSHYTA